MDQTRQVDIFQLVKDHFSKATDSDGLIVWEDVRGYGYDDARRAIEDHRREKGAMAYRPDPRRIRTLAATYARERRQRDAKRLRVIDWIRQHDDDRAMLHDLPDSEAIIAKYRRAYEAVMDSGADQAGISIARAYIQSHAAAALREVGHPESEVARDARFCAGLEDGQRLEKPRCERGGLAQPFGSDVTPPPVQQPYQAVRGLKLADAAAS